ncbi:peroxiredoxin family protein [Aquimarina sp. W85]|uniref:peroxiredoxin family protein n=1 Tax=Aquimarina rhodophyticola TaxID=3342246 RepID=UPI00366F6FF8
MKKIILLLTAIFLITGCKQNKKQEIYTLKSGPWRATLSMQDHKKAPFLFEVFDDQSLEIFNAEESIEVHEITIVDDSITIKLPVFEGYIKAKFISDSHIKGEFIIESLNRSVPFEAHYGVQDRFAIKTKPKFEITGSWETMFSPNTQDSYIAKGIFKQNGNIVTGTFRTTTGDYRFLEGVLNGDKLQLSTFDGAHAFLFTAQVTNSVMQGTFYSGQHWQEPFTAKLNPTYELPSEDSLTTITEEGKAFSFEFPDAQGNLVSNTDPEFKDKVLVIQVLGTWCPNCVDETKYYKQFYEANKDKNLAFIGLAFEYAKTEEKAFQSIQRFKNSLDVPYPILLAQYGSSSKQKAQEKLPMLNHVLSYPTTVILDTEGKVKKIHTGFNGPATGQKYIDFKNEFESFMKTLLEE